MTATARPPISRFLRVNRHPGDCALCGEHHDLHFCTRCRARVAWVRGKSSRYYLASCYRKANGSEVYRVYDFDPHRCRTEEG